MGRKKLLSIIIPAAAAIMVIIAVIIIRFSSRTAKTDGTYSSECFSFISIAGTEEGLLYIKDNMLRFTDVNSQLDTYVCSRPNCEHSNKTGTECEAYMGGGWLNFVMDEEYIYLIGDAQGTLYYNDEVSGYIMRENRDGSGKEKVVEYSGIQTITSCKLYGNYIAMSYINTEDYSNPLEPVELEEQELGIAVYNTVTGKFSSQVIAKGETVDCLMNIDIYEDKVYCGYYRRSAEQDTFTNIYCSINIEDMEVEELLVMENVPIGYVTGKAAKDCYIYIDYNDDNNICLYRDGEITYIGNDNNALGFWLVEDCVVYYSGMSLIKKYDIDTGKTMVLSNGMEYDILAQTSSYLWFVDSEDASSLRYFALSNSDLLSARWDKAVYLMETARGASGTGEVVVEDDSEDDQRTELVWIMPSYAKLTKEQLININEILRDKGYDFKLKLVYMNVIQDYKERLEEYLEDSDADIVFAGMDYDNGIEEPVSIIESGILYDFTDELNSESGRQLYGCFDEALWELTEYDGRSYIIPNTGGDDGSVNCIVFNDKYISKDEAAEFDGTIYGLQELYERYAGDESVIVSGISMNDYIELSSPDYISRYGVVISENEGKAYSVAECEDIKAQFSIINELYKSGKWVEMDENTTIQNYADNYFAYITYGNYYSVMSDNVYYYSPLMYSWMGLGYGISASSSHKEEALEFLTLVMTDRDIANAILYGIEGVDYNVEDGIVYGTGTGIFESSSLRADMTGVYLAADKTSEDNPEGTRYDNAQIGWNMLRVSRYHNVFLNMGDYEDILTALGLVNSGIPLYTSGDFEAEWETYANSLKDAGVDTILDALNNELEQYIENDN